MFGRRGRRRAEQESCGQGEPQAACAVTPPEVREGAAPAEECSGDLDSRSAVGLHLTGVRVEAEGPEGVVPLLQDVDLTLTARRVAVVGENGSGKSTLARAVAGLADVVEGTVTVHGVDAVEDVKALRRTVGFVFANPAAQSIMPTVREDVELTVRSLRDEAGRRLTKDQITARADAALAEHRLTELADRPCLALSSGQAQRLALCAVTAAQPSLVIADEPTSLLDGRHRRIVADRLLAADGFQLLLVTHDLELARACDEAVWVHEGRVRTHGPAGDVVDAYEAFLDEAVAEEFGTGRPVGASTGEAPDAGRGTDATPGLGEPVR